MAEVSTGAHQVVRRRTVGRVGGLSHGKMGRQQSLVPGAAGVCDCCLQRHHPADDRGQLLPAGYFRPGKRGVRRHGMVQGDVDRQTPARRPGAPISFFGTGAADRDSPGHPDRPGHAQKRVGGVGQSRDSGHSAADSLERDRHHLDHLHPSGHRPFRRGDQQPQPA
ncbi:hypothetical protein DESC_720274 [Desulfosarcina cetonica]|nr:hypothetical protein DESC_720274 [Desulfosarcina cetonica]